MVDATPAEEPVGGPAGPRPHHFPCAQCGAVLEFHPGSGRLKCAFCGHENAIPQTEAEIEELDFRAALAAAADAAETEEVTTVGCVSCGAEFTLDPGIRSDACPFCGRTVVTEPRRSAHLRPRSLLPFAIDAREARERFRAWLGGLWFAPNALRRSARADGGLSGMYVPYWTYDCATTSSYRGERGDDYIVMETYTRVVDGKRTTGTRPVTKTRWTRVAGTVRRRFDDVLVLASTSLPAGRAAALEPWDLDNLVPYQPGYLSGFRAETYRIDLAQGFERAKEIMAGVISADVRRDIGGDRQRIRSLTTRHADITFKHVLLPIWLATYRFNGRPYTFLVNGRTGEVQGDRPYSWVKIALAVLLALLVAALVFYLTQE